MVVRTENYGLEFRIKLLACMKADCRYFLGYGNRCVKHLWAGNVTDQIDTMLALWDSIPEDSKPAWLSREDIIKYKREMESPVSAFA